MALYGSYEAASKWDYFIYRNKKALHRSRNAAFELGFTTINWVLHTSVVLKGVAQWFSCHSNIGHRGAVQALEPSSQHWGSTAYQSPIRLSSQFLNVKTIMYLTIISTTLISDSVCQLPQNITVITCAHHSSWLSHITLRMSIYEIGTL